jgi:hypothetical protein
VPTPPRVSRQMRALLRQWRNPAWPECGSREDVQRLDDPRCAYLCDICAYEWRVLRLTERLGHEPDALAEVVERVEGLVLASVRDEMRLDLREHLVALGFGAYEVQPLEDD